MNLDKPTALKLSGSWGVHSLKSLDSSVPVAEGDTLFGENATSEYLPQWRAVRAVSGFFSRFDNLSGFILVVGAQLFLVSMGLFQCGGATEVEIKGAQICNEY